MATPVVSGPTYSLDQFGPVASPGDAEKTFRKASADIIAAGGGVLVIPGGTATGWSTLLSWPPSRLAQFGVERGLAASDLRRLDEVKVEKCL